MAIDTFAAIAVRVVSTLCSGEADAHAIAGGVANFRAGATVVSARLTGDAGIAHAYAGGAVCADSASRNALALDTLAAVTVRVVSARRGEADAEVIWGGPAFFVEAAALAIGGIAGGTSAIGKAKSGGAIRVDRASGDTLAAYTFAAIAVRVVSACRGEANAHAVNGSVANFRAGAAVGSARLAGDAGIAHAYADGAIRADNASGDALAAHAFAAVAVCVAGASGRRKANAHAVTGGMANFRAGAAVGSARLTGDAGVVYAYADGAVCADNASGDALAAHAFAAVAVCVVSASGCGEANAHAVAGGMANFRVGVTAVGRAWLAGDAGVVEAYADGAIRVDNAAVGEAFATLARPAARAMVVAAADAGYAHAALACPTERTLAVLGATAGGAYAHACSCADGFHAQQSVFALIPAQMTVAPHAEFFFADFNFRGDTDAFPWRRCRCLPTNFPLGTRRVIALRAAFQNDSSCVTTQENSRKQG